MSQQLFYIQDTRSHVGNSMLWWRHDSCGYVCDIRKAKVFTAKEARAICRGRGRFARTNRRDGKRMWPKDYIDKRVAAHVDMQECKWQEAMREPTP